MTPRRPNFSAAGADFALAALALASGWAGTPLAYSALVFVGAAGVWAWTRRAALGAMAPRQRLTSSALALTVLAGVLGGAYWLGLTMGGHR